MTIGAVYLGLLVVGVVYALMTGAMGWLSDLGGTDVHVDASGHFDVGHPHPVSGTTIATFITGFGAGGVVAHYLLRWPFGWGLLVATGSGLLLAGAAYLVLDLIFSQTQAGSEHTTDDAVGREAEVITPIPEGGTGEIAYVIRGQREVAPARSADGASIPRGCVVIIEKMIGQTAYVRVKS
jgi:membrane protein implicated in regulation of membrane protease activity